MKPQDPSLRARHILPGVTMVVVLLATVAALLAWKVAAERHGALAEAQSQLEQRAEVFGNSVEVTLQMGEQILDDVDGLPEPLAPALRRLTLASRHLEDLRLYAADGALLARGGFGPLSGAARLPRWVGRLTAQDVDGGVGAAGGLLQVFRRLRDGRVAVGVIDSRYLGQRLLAMPAVRDETLALVGADGAVLLVARDGVPRPDAGARLGEVIPLPAAGADDLLTHGSHALRTGEAVAVVHQLDQYPLRVFVAQPVRAALGAWYADVARVAALALTIGVFSAAALVYWWRMLRREKRLAAELAEMAEDFRATFEQAPVGIVHTSPDGHFQRFNPKFAAIVGRDTDELQGLSWWDLSDAEDGARSAALAQRLLHGEADTGSFEKRYRRKDGSQVDVHLTLALRRDAAGSPLHFISVVEDITAHKAAEQQLALAASVFHNSAESIVITDTDARIVDVNPAFSRLTGYARDEVIGRNPRLLQSGRHGADFYRRLWQSLREHGGWKGEIWNRRRDGEIYPAWMNVSAVRDEHGQVKRFVAVAHDISAAKDHEAALARMAYHDMLTGLPNRALLADRMRMAMADARREDGAMAVVYFDLDGFKPINDAHGHDVGDALLIALSRRVERCLRATDTLARIGGDEFVVLLTRLRDRAECEAAIERIREAIGLPFELPAHDVTVRVGASLGVAVYPEDDVDADRLLRHADQAMYQAKQHGGDTWRCHPVVEA